GETLGILANEFLGTAGNVQAVEVVPRLVPVIETHVDEVRIALGKFGYLYPHALEPRQIAGRRRVSARCWFRRWVNGIDVEVLVAIVVLGVKNVLAVARPEITRHRPFRFRREKSSGFERLPDRLDVDIPRVLPRLQKSQILAVGRKLGGGDLRITEDQVA